MADITRKIEQQKKITRAKNLDITENLVKQAESTAAAKGKLTFSQPSLHNSGGWDMLEGGGVINGREYSQHAMERMAPDIPAVRAELSRRGEKLASSKGYTVGSREYNREVTKYVDPRNIPPSVVEDAIQNTVGVMGNTPNSLMYETDDIKVITNSVGKVITVIPK